MILHQNLEMFREAVKATAEALDYTEDAIQRNYWMTFLLCRLASSTYGNQLTIQEEIFFPNDYVLAPSSNKVSIVVHTAGKTTAQARQLVQDILHEIQLQLQGFPGTCDTTSNDRLIINSVFFQTSMEVTIRAVFDSVPSRQLPIQMYISQFFAQRNLLDLIKQYQLLPFEVSVAALS